MFTPDRSAAGRGADSAGRWCRHPSLLVHAGSPDNPRRVRTDSPSSGVYDFLASTKDANGNPLQALGLSFFGQGLAAGGILNFSLNVANQSTPPQLVSQTPGVSITLDPATSTGSSGSNGSSGTTVTTLSYPNLCLSSSGQPWPAPGCCAVPSVRRSRPRCIRLTTLWSPVVSNEARDGKLGTNSPQHHRSLTHHGSLPSVGTPWQQQGESALESTACVPTDQSRPFRP